MVIHNTPQDDGYKRYYAHFYGRVRSSRSIPTTISRHRTHAPIMQLTGAVPTGHKSLSEVAGIAKKVHFTIYKAPDRDNKRHIISGLLAN